jgi:hypothetical protein
MIGQRGVEVESMPANQHTVGSVTETRRAAGRHAAGFGPLRPAGGERDGSPGVKYFPIDRDRPCLRECLLIFTGQAGPSGVSAQRISRAGH